MREYEYVIRCWIYELMYKTMEKYTPYLLSPIMFPNGVTVSMVGYMNGILHLQAIATNSRASTAICVTLLLIM